MWLSIQRLASAIPLFLLSLDLKIEGTVSPVNMKGGTSLTALLIVAWSSLCQSAAATKDNVEQHLEMGNKMLAAGQLADALSHYHAAVEVAPDNYVVFYRRATVYLAMGKSRSALPDLDKVVELKPDFNGARVQRGSVKLKQGKLVEAHMDFEQVLAREPTNADALHYLEQIEPVKNGKNSARQMYAGHDYQGAIDALHTPIEVCPWDPELRELRADCYIAQGDYFKAIGDLRPTTKLRNDNTNGYFRISKLHYSMGEADESLTEIRECLKLDPDHKNCYDHYKKVKKLVKQIQSVFSFITEERWDDCVDKAKQMIKTEPNEFTYTHRAKGHICHCYAKAGNVKEALQACNEVLDVDENNVEAICDRAEAYIANEQFEEAIEDYRKAESILPDHRRAKEGLLRAQKLLKQSQKRDYYKILGVKRNASKKEILKAYRKLAVEWHPDKYDGDDKGRAEKMFYDIAAAKEVLTDTEKRQQFDNGEDPLDPEQQQGGGGHPWNQGFNPFGQGFNFKFHFN